MTEIKSKRKGERKINRERLIDSDSHRTGRCRNSVQYVQYSIAPVSGEPVYSERREVYWCWVSLITDGCVYLGSWNREK